MAIAGVTDDSAELRSRIAIAMSVLGHAPLYRAVRMAMAALKGASLAELAADNETDKGCPEGMPPVYLRGWHDGYDAGFAAALEQFGHGAPEDGPR